MCTCVWENGERGLDQSNGFECLMMQNHYLFGAGLTWIEIEREREGDKKTRCNSETTGYDRIEIVGGRLMGLVIDNET